MPNLIRMFRASDDALLATENVPSEGTHDPADIFDLTALDGVDVYFEMATEPTDEYTTPAFTAPTIGSAHISDTQGGTVITEADVGDVLWAVANSVTGYPTPTLDYQWEVNGNPPGGTDDEESFDTTGLDDEDEVTVEITVTNAAGDDDATSAGVEVEASGAVLSSPLDTAISETLNFTASVSTDTDDGTLYWGIYASATPADPADIEAGTGTSGANGSQAISGTGTQNISATSSGLAGNVTGYVHFVQKIGSEYSNVVVGDGFTTAIYGPELVVNGSGLTDTAGWTSFGNAALSAVSGELQIAYTDTATNEARQDWAMEIGQKYEVKLHRTFITAGAASAFLGRTYSNAAYISNQAPTSQTSYDIWGESLGAFLRLRGGAAADRVARWANTSCRRVLGDNPNLIVDSADLQSGNWDLNNVSIVGGKLVSPATGLWDATTTLGANLVVGRDYIVRHDIEDHTAGVQRIRILDAGDDVIYEGSTQNGGGVFSFRFTMPSGTDIVKFRVAGTTQGAHTTANLGLWEIIP